MKSLLDRMIQYAQKPALFERGEEKFWDDPHIAKSMLEAHLDFSHDAASRRLETIDRTVEHLVASGVLKPGNKLLDLGCGPGLYAEKLKLAGIDVVGIDISRNSVEYARQHSKEMGLDIEYRCMDFFELDFENEFDAVIQVYGELNVFPDGQRDKLLSLIRRALKPDGTLIFDITTRELRRKICLKGGWYTSEGGFWRPGRHIVLERGFDYPESDVWLDQYIVVDDYGCKVYRNWFHDYTLAVLEALLGNAGYQTTQVWNDLTGSRYEEGGDWIAIAAKVS